ncbi:MAG: diacylglycerol kinase family protein [Actinomycetaceae bacterium]|nr:diacylglycerol kinase family protein [Actinomycetaceae bacterium]
MAPSVDLFISSISDHGSAVKVAPTLESLIRDLGWQVRTHITTAADNPEDLARSSNADYVAGCGGDGFLRSLACGVVHSGAIFLPIPGGRGNDLCRCLGIGIDPIARARALEGAKKTHLDMMAVTSADGQRRLALGIVSFGLDATANRLANDARWLTWGPLAYAWGGAVALVKMKPQPIPARIDNEAQDLGGWVTSISNSGWFGGGIQLAPTSDMTDGVLEVVHVPPIARHRALAALSHVLLRRKTHPVVTYQSAQRVHIDGPAGLVAMADGDCVGQAPLTIEVLPRALHTLV